MSSGESVQPGPVAVFGSGETAPEAQRVHDALMRRVNGPIRACVLETPAGFELNSADVAGRLATFVREHLPNYRPEVTVIPAPARNGIQSRRPRGRATGPRRELRAGGARQSHVCSPPTARQPRLAGCGCPPSDRRDVGLRERDVGRDQQTGHTRLRDLQGRSRSALDSRPRSLWAIRTASDVRAALEQL